MEMVTMVVVGGMASTFGAVVGAGLLTLLPQLLSGFEQWHHLLFGVILVGVIIFLPRGLVPSLSHYIAERRRAENAVPATRPVYDEIPQTNTADALALAAEAKTGVKAAKAAAAAAGATAAVVSPFAREMPGYLSGGAADKGSLS
jgi:hypothetical protein